jgi:hypothetical protein
MKRNRMLPDSAAYVAVVPDSARKARRQFTRDESRRVMRRVRDILDRSTPGSSDPAGANLSPDAARFLALLHQAHSHYRPTGDIQELFAFHAAQQSCWSQLLREVLAAATDAAVAGNASRIDSDYPDLDAAGHSWFAFQEVARRYGNRAANASIDRAHRGFLFADQQLNPSQERN